MKQCLVQDNGGNSFSGVSTEENIRPHAYTLWRSSKRKSTASGSHYQEGFGFEHPTKHARKRTSTRRKRSSRHKTAIKRQGQRRQRVIDAKHGITPDKHTATPTSVPCVASHLTTKSHALSLTQAHLARILQASILSTPSLPILLPKTTHRSG